MNKRLQRIKSLQLRKSVLVFIALVIILTPGVATSSQQHQLMPVPREIIQVGQEILPSRIQVTYKGPENPRVQRAINRFSAQLQRLSDSVEVITAGDPTTQPKQLWTLSVYVEEAETRFPQFGTDESYRLDVAADRATLRAVNGFGLLHGLQSLLQLIGGNQGQLSITTATIIDSPRFPWRGLLLDVARHFQPVGAIKRTLDGMAAVKLNVLHFHLTDDHGFRVESKRFPKLHQLGSEGQYYSQDDIREIVRYAADRGIRVVPEFDMPGHTSSYLVAYPELGSRPGPYLLAKGPGVYDGILDPTREETYTFIESLLEEMTPLFPDSYWHFGGDEVPPHVWEESDAIQAFMAKNEIVDAPALQAHFNRRLLEIIRRQGKRAVGWEEIIHPDLSAEIVVQHWLPDIHFDQRLAARHNNLVSRGFYLDHMKSAAWHYEHDPLTLKSSAIEQPLANRIIGGEAAQWGEFVTAENLDTRLWPRLAAIAERFWSPQQTQDIDDMYRRLRTVDQRLHDLGLAHRTHLQRYLASLTGGELNPQLEALATITTPVGFNSFMSWRGIALMIVPSWMKPWIDYPPLDNFSNMIQVESLQGQQFEHLVDRYLAGETTQGPQIQGKLEQWHAIYPDLRDSFDRFPKLGEVEPLAENVLLVADIGLSALRALSGQPIRPALLKRDLEHLTELKPPAVDDFEQALRARTFSWKPLILKQTDIAIIPAVEKLLLAAIADQ